jgi:hypothetical protein
MVGYAQKCSFIRVDKCLRKTMKFADWNGEAAQQLKEAEMDRDGETIGIRFNAGYTAIYLRLPAWHF